MGYAWRRAKDEKMPDLSVVDSSAGGRSVDESETAGGHLV
jgi:hypothetical protein